MITNFDNHSANERTFLAWVRTAVAIAGFGIIIGKLPGSQGSGSNTGLVLLVLSALLILLALARFIVIRRQISAQLESEKGFVKMEVLFTAVLAALVSTMIVFLYHLA